MAEQRLGIIMHGVTGRMGTNQHLARSIVAMRNQGGVLLENGDRIVLDPILVGRSEEKLRTLAQEYGVVRWTTDLGEALADPRDRLFFDAGTTQMRAALIERAILAGKDIYTEKPVAENINDALKVATLAQKAGIANGVVQDKLFLPGLIKLRRLRDEGFFGRILAARIDFGYWVFDGFEAPAQRPAWNYQLGQGGGIILDMFCHWRYVLDHTIAPVTGVCCIGRNHIPQRRDDEGESYIADADDGAFAMLELEGNVIAQVASSWATRVRRDDLVTVQVDGTAGSAVAGLQRCWVQSGAETPRPIWNPDEPQSMTFPDQWREVYANESFDNGFKAQWRLFLRHLYDGAPYIYDLMEGVKGVQLADAALKSWRTRRWVEIGAAVGIA